MLGQSTSAGRSKRAAGARVCFFATVGVHVAFEVVVRVRSVQAVGAGIWFDSCVRGNVSLKVRDEVARVRTVGTVVRLPGRVGFGMCLCSCIVVAAGPLTLTDHHHLRASSLSYSIF